MKKLTYGPIIDKLEDIQLEGQGCLNDCQRAYWTGSNPVFNLFTNNCKKNIDQSAFVSVKY